MFALGDPVQEAHYPRHCTATTGDKLPLGAGPTERKRVNTLAYLAGLFGSMKSYSKEKNITSPKTHHIVHPLLNFQYKIGQEVVNIPPPIHLF